MRGASDYEAFVAANYASVLRSLSLALGDRQRAEDIVVAVTTVRDALARLTPRQRMAVVLRHLASGTTGFVPGGPISPDGRTLAVFAATPGGGQVLVLVDLVAGTAGAPVPGSGSAAEAQGLPTPVAWSPTGGTVYFGRGGRTVLASYHSGDAEAQPVATGLRPFSALVAIGR